MEFTCEGKTILAAITVSAIILVVMSVLIILMYRNIRRIIRDKSIDNSLNKELENKNKTIKNLKDQKLILMKENIIIANQRNDLAILLQQKKGL